MNQLEIRNQDNSLRSEYNDIDANEVLREFGIDDISEETRVVVSVDGNIISNNISVNTNMNDIVDRAVRDMDIEDAVVTEYHDNDNSATEAILYAQENIGYFINEIDDLAVVRANLSSTHLEPNIAQEVKIEDENTLPLNSTSNKIKESTIRFSGASWFEEVQKKSIIIGGCGGISSFVISMLSRMHPMQIFVYDDDSVETVNLAGQFFNKDSVGSKKVDAISSIVKNFSDYHSIMSIPEKFTQKTPGGNIMICGFDNMEARNIFYNVWKTHVSKSNNPQDCLFIDGRLDLNSMQIFCIVGDDTYNMNRYEKEFLFNDIEADETVCSMKQTTYCANMIGSLICNLYTNFCANLVGGIFDLPFKTHYDANCMFFKTES